MKESTLALMAWRNLWRNHRRTLITLSSIAFGILLAILFTGLGDKTWGDMIDLAARMGSGHVTLQHPGYLDAPNLKKTVTGIAIESKAVYKVLSIKYSLVNSTIRVSSPAPRFGVSSSISKVSMTPLAMGS